ncbi:cache domain-containing protein [Fangia hongkongensis]|uniref:PDC sensor domain-containing protein n=1 Tax=Fangia hongkongensis TaxID=270495 RepID=UPI0003806A6C|nr:cache domain-containing protein [Fangia hongkongensis]MBK2124076.1 cache domain-containing protein [Fangia hongkongensis]
MQNVSKILLFFCMTLILFACSEHKDQSKHLSKEELETGQFSDEIEAHLSARTKQLEVLFTNATIVKSVLDADKLHQGHGTFDHDNSQKIDDKMQAQKNTHAVQELLHNACASVLKSFQRKHRAFVEIFITDTGGFNVCQTNMTSDFYQADESWWQEAYNKGKGKTYHSDMEYDASANEIAVSIYVPLYQGDKLIGISKSVLSINDIMRSHLA